ncbi:MAG: hypothetical protein ACK5LR_12365 [Mangrovibacterium sp.]
MTTKVLNVSARTPNDDANSLGQAIVSKKGLLGEGASAYALALMSRVEKQVFDLNQVIMEERVKSDSRQYVVEMKSVSRNFYRMIVSFASMKSASVQLAAQNVLAVITPYQKKLASSTRQLTVNSYITSMLADLDEMDLSSILYANTTVGELKKAQANFIASYADYRDLRNQQVAKANATQLKNELIVLLNTELASYLNAMVYEDASTYGAFADAVASIVRSHRVALKTRATRSRNAASVATQA